MASSIDADLPAEGLAYTADVRSNFAFAKSEISALQASTTVVTTRGDIVTGSAAGAEQRVAVGAANTVLRSDGTDPAWGKIAVANLASGTDGQLITWDASGVAAVVATGNSTQVLTSNGAGAAPTFQAAGAGDLVASNNLSDVASASTSRTNLGLTIGTHVQAYDAQLADVAGLAVTNSGFIVGDGSNFVLETGSTLKTSLGLTIGTDVQAYDADTLKADTADVLTAGFATTIHDAGTKSSGTYTPDEADGNMQKAVNGGAHTLAPPANDCTLVIQYTNDGSAGTITTSGFTVVDGDTITTTSGHDFFFYVTNSDAFSLLTVKALQ